MKRSFRAFLAAALIALPLLSSCNDAMAPEVPNTPANIERQDGLLGGLLGGVVDLVGGTVNGLVNLVGGILTGPDANGSEKSAWIDSRGGTIRTAAYTLVVPRGAVSTKTKFVIEPENNGSYTVNLHAYRQGLLGLIDVGGRGFDRPVQLTISYDKANGVRDERKLVIIYLASPDEAEVQKTSVDRKDKEVTAKLKHFSKYAMAQN
jgi:hypothetical protein